MGPYSIAGAIPLSGGRSNFSGDLAHCNTCRTSDLGTPGARGTVAMMNLIGDAPTTRLLSLTCSQSATLPSKM